MKPSITPHFKAEKHVEEATRINLRPLRVVEVELEIASGLGFSV